MNTLIDIQSRLNAPKNLYNKFGGYNYRSCESILEAVKPLLKEYNATLTITDTLEQIGDRYYVKATARYMHGEFGTFVTAYAREAETKKGMDDSQITGTASSYARKYALNGLFLIDDNKDADTDEFHKQNEPDKIDADTVKMITATANDLGIPIASILKTYRLKKIEDMTKEQFVDCTRKFEAEERKHK